MKECACTFAQKMNGDGCSVCNPQHYIEILEERIVALEDDIELLIETLEEVGSIEDMATFLLRSQR